MSDFTSISFHGRLTEDPISGESERGPYCKYTVACNRRLGKGKERTSFLPTTVFGKQAELCQQFLSKGREVTVLNAELETDTYKDKEGITRKGFACVVRSGEVIFGSGGRTVGEERDERDESEQPREQRGYEPPYARASHALRGSLGRNKRPLPRKR